MSPNVTALACLRLGFPRVSGDEPLLFALRQALKEFSPRERG